MSANPPPPPFYPGDEIALRAYVERMVSDLVAASTQKWADARMADTQRWDDHQAVHAKDVVALTRALEQATVALAAALEAHRREHGIAEAAQDKADESHQVQHRALNELRDVVGDLTARYVPISSLATITEGWERRFDDRAKEFNAYREGLAKEQAAYRDTVRGEISTLRDTLAKEIASLRDTTEKGIASLREAGAKGEGRGLGSAAVVAGAFGTIGAIGAIIGIVLALTR